MAVHHRPFLVRVFALLKSMFDEQQLSSLADILEAALMLRYNGRRVG